MAVSSLSGAIFEIHAAIAGLSSIPELELTTEQSDKLAKAVSNVSKYYPVPALSPQKTALIMLGWTVYSVYSPIARAVVTRKRAEAGAAPAQAQSAYQPADIVQAAQAAQASQPHAAAPWFTPGQGQSGLIQ